MTDDERLLPVQFLLPTLDREGRPYPRRLQRLIERELADRFGAWSLVAGTPLPGAWRNPESGDVEYDESWRYEVGVASRRVQELDDFLANVAHRLGQKALWRVVYSGSEGKVVPARAAPKRRS